MSDVADMHEGGLWCWRVLALGGLSFLAFYDAVWAVAMHGETYTRILCIWSCLTSVWSTFVVFHYTGFVLGTTWVISFALAILDQTSLPVSVRKEKCEMAYLYARKMVDDHDWYYMYIYRY